MTENGPLGEVIAVSVSQWRAEELLLLLLDSGQNTNSCFGSCFTQLNFQTVQAGLKKKRKEEGLKVECGHK